PVLGCERACPAAAPSALSSTLALVKASHPGPTLVVTVVGTALGAAAGNTLRTCILLALALLTGQLSISRSNDVRAGARDVAAARADKPVAVGSVAETTVRRAAGLAV